MLEDADNQEERRPTRVHRRYSDSYPYCKARDGEGPNEGIIQPENPVLSQAKYLDQERLAFIQRYLENAEDARNVTTETSYSGMPGTYGAPSELDIDIQRYLEKAEDARSMTTDTSDSGMQGTYGAPSELGIEETRGN